MTSFPNEEPPVGFRPLWRTPMRQSIPWPPVPTGKKYEVFYERDDPTTDFDETELNDSLWTLARMAGRRNPFDIAIYNFGTDDPYEINWYLHKYVGCRWSDDGKNFCFRSAKPGVMYLPPQGWVPDKRFKRGSGRGNFYPGLISNVAGTIDRVAAQFPTLRHNGMTVGRHDLQAVADLIRMETVKVHVNPYLDSYGTYDSNTYSITLKSFPNQTVAMTSTIGNEATHAALHRKNTFIADRYEEEFFSFVVGGVAAALLNPRQIARYAYDIFNGGWVYFIGYVVLKEFGHRSIVDVNELNQEFTYPGGLPPVANPVEQLKLDMHSSYDSRKGKSKAYDWDPPAD